MYRVFIIFGAISLCLLWTCVSPQASAADNLNKGVSGDTIELKALQGKLDPKQFPLAAAVDIPQHTDYDQPIDYSGNDINTAIKHSHTTFKNKVQYQLTHFMQPVSFTVDDFIQPALFYNSIFEQTVDFSWSQFRQTAGFSHTTFNQPASFFSTIFYNTSSFYSSEFNQTADFENAYFKQSTDFIDTFFNQQAFFHFAVFQQQANFSRATFAQTAVFSYASFKSTANFNNASFTHSADFSHAKFAQHVAFNGTVLPEYLDLSYIDLPNGDIDLSNSQLPTTTQRCNINLVGTRLDKIKLDYTNFQLIFPDTASDREISHVYDGLLNSLRQHGYKEGYKKLAIEYKQYQYQKDNKWIINFVQKHWWNYGFNKERIFLWIFSIILAFTVANTFFYSWLLKHAYQAPFLRNKLINKSLHANLVFRYILLFPFALLYTVFIIFHGLFGFQRKAEELRSGNLFATIYVFIMIAFGLISTLFILEIILGRNPW